MLELWAICSEAASDFCHPKEQIIIGDAEFLYLAACTSDVPISSQGLVAQLVATEAFVTATLVVGDIAVRVRPEQASAPSRAVAVSYNLPR